MRIARTMRYRGSDWQNADKDLLNFTQKLIHFRKHHPVFRRRRWFQGLPIHAAGTLEDIAWFLPEGKEMSEENWRHDFAKSLGVFLNGHGIRSAGPRGEIIVDESFYVIFNAYHEALKYILPSKRYGKAWVKVIDTSLDLMDENNERFKAGKSITVKGRSVVVLKQVV